MIINEETKIIPGHGKISNIEEYKSFLVMLETIKSNIQNAINAGQSEDDIKVDGSLTKVYDDLRYGTGFINSERFRLTFYKSLKDD